MVSLDVVLMSVQECPTYLEVAIFVFPVLRKPYSQRFIEMTFYYHRVTRSSDLKIWQGIKILPVFTCIFPNFFIWRRQCTSMTLSAVVCVN